jgi:hypothetical protein
VDPLEARLASDKHDESNEKLRYLRLPAEEVRVNPNDHILAIVFLSLISETTKQSESERRKTSPAKQQ